MRSRKNRRGFHIHIHALETHPPARTQAADTFIRKAKQRDRPDILSLTAWSSKHRCRSPDPIRNCQPTHRSVLSRHCHADARRKNLRCIVLLPAPWLCSFQYPRSSRIRTTSTALPMGASHKMDNPLQIRCGLLQSKQRSPFTAQGVCTPRR